VLTAVRYLINELLTERRLADDLFEVHSDEKDVAGVLFVCVRIAGHRQARYVDFAALDVGVVADVQDTTLHIQLTRECQHMSVADNKYIVRERRTAERDSKVIIQHDLLCIRIDDKLAELLLC